jgi:hypothetical protein
VIWNFSSFGDRGRTRNGSNMDGLLVRQKLACCKQAQFEARWMLLSHSHRIYTFQGAGDQQIQLFCLPCNASKP